MVDGDPSEAAESDASARAPIQPSAGSIWVRQRLAQPGLVDLVVDELASAAGCSKEEAESALGDAVADGKLRVIEVASCPCCQYQLAPDELVQGKSTGVCPSCNRAFTDCGSGIQFVSHFLREAEPGRSVPWVLVLHGMNTNGAWQEQFSWRVATTYGRSVPVFIYKYGKVVTGVFLSWRRRALVRQLHDRIRDLAAERTDSPLGSRPDVIAHSFGTWMLGHALASNDPELADLAVGRVILVGCILRPDFPWGDILARGRAEAVLNHFSHADRWARVSGFAISDAGPSGHRGFDSSSAEVTRSLVINRSADGFGHSDYFDSRLMPDVYKDVWKPFLTSPLQSLGGTSRTDPASRWSPTPAVVPFGAAILVFTLVATAFAIFVTVLILGIAQLVTTLA